MMYHKRLVACVKVNGKILRESGEEVILPFGSEYSILLKNQNSLRVMVRVSIDGTDVTDGRWLIIEPNDSVELERFIRNGNLQAGNRLKFIERTDQIEESRGVQVDDGLVRVEWKTEKVIPKPIVTHSYHYDHYHHYNHWPYYSYPRLSGMTWPDNTTYTSNTRSLGAAIGGSVGAVQAMNCSLSANLTKSSKSEVSTMDRNQCGVNDAGITVPGSESNQQFQHGGWFSTEDVSEVLVLRLRGRSGTVKASKPVTVKTKVICSTCSKQNKPTDHFCSQCGTSLRLI